ncbi:transposase [Pirellula sp. SH-Sr6A]
MRRHSLYSLGTNACSESTNRKIMSIKGRASGVRNVANFNRATLFYWMD